MKRRDFLSKAALAGLAGGTALLAGCQDEGTSTNQAVAPAQVKKNITWKMVTTWPPKLPILQTGAELYARRVEEMTDGRMKIQVYAANELVPGLGVFDAVSSGTAECGSGSAYYWAGKDPACQWFSAVPFGLNAQGLNAWFYSGGGLELWDEVYGQFNLIGRPMGNTGVQMGGWFNKEINTIDDFKGLKMRIPGLGGKVIAKAGGTVVLLAGGEIFTSLERGVIDATEWVGPLHDLRMGFYQAAKYYYYPGWHEAGSCLDVMFNKDKFMALPKDIQMVMKMAAAAMNQETLCQFEALNGAALEELVTKHKVKLKRFPPEVLVKLRGMAREVLAEEAAKSPLATKVAAGFDAFQKQWGTWADVSSRAYFDTIAERYVDAG
ncbi:TRAP transporter substrate-binding protein [Pseudodesulfovibrio piezophilus]|uniref:TRAP dicarboxylate transporter-DctP subunit n=1 Tax=Pseudodesulfovibrio piezophilus (strain DSM 21447 / JCM 15486 / C1TLV30) TaxID=1322246 RepID=M1WWH3_PSEP2|nr:TRAP transporter substrate-binding protein [Pseudodesulfovibrio piezophilus]CCH49138.1 TRAP dicarboxylate transporter-DctP subunit [Pseudodesulfovibrio piezophilus C1TLV30]